MRLGDILEWLGGLCLIAAGYEWSGLAMGLLAAAIVLVYEGQVWASHNLPWQKGDEK